MKRTGIDPKYDWPTRKKAEHKSDGAGPDMWPTGDEKRRTPQKERKWR